MRDSIGFISQGAKIKTTSSDSPRPLARLAAFDLVALEQGPPLRVTNVLPVPAGATCVPVLAQRALLDIASR